MILFLPEKITSRTKIDGMSIRHRSAGEIKNHKKSDVVIVVYHVKQSWNRKKSTRARVWKKHKTAASA